MQAKLLIEIGDYLIDEVRDKYNIYLEFVDMDKIGEDCIEVAKIRYKRWKQLLSLEVKQ